MKGDLARLRGFATVEGADVKMSDAESFRARKTIFSDTGFSILELMVVVTMIMVLMAFATIQMQPAVQQIRANAALDAAKGAVRLGRELSISQRRTIVIQFALPAASSPCVPGADVTACIELSQISEPGNVVQPPFQVTPISGNVQFMTFSGVDTPDGYGVPATGGIMFGGIIGGPPSGMEFQSDGTFTDGNGNPINGTVFMGIPNIATTARAVTILGNTGRVHTYWGNTSGWYYGA
jgi:type II secretory pathway pseudopilin PulG